MPVVDRVEITHQRLAAQRPDLDLSGWNLLARVARVWFLAGEAIAEVLKPFGLTQHEYVLLASLRDLGPPYASSPSRLLEAAVITTSGGLANMLNRLESRRLVKRGPDPADRRGVLVTLTPAGLELIQDATTAYIAVENRLVSGLGREKVRELTLGLRDLLVAIDPVMLPRAREEPESRSNKS
jgi:DNA-binding MarR family transcriptional regulator